MRSVIPQEFEHILWSPFCFVKGKLTLQSGIPLAKQYFSLTVSLTSLTAVFSNLYVAADQSTPGDFTMARRKGVGVARNA